MRTVALVLSFAFLFALVPHTALAGKQHPGITCELWASSPSRVIKPGEPVTISWNSSGALLWYGPGGVKIPPAGSMVVSPEKRTIYKFKFLGLGGNRTCGIRIRIEGEKLPEV